MKRIAVLASFALLLAACASGPPPGAGLTLKSLDDQPRVLLREITPTERELALRAWEAYLAIATDDERRMLAMRRIADLELLIAEDALVAGRGGGRADFVRVVEAYDALLVAYPGYPGQDEVHYQVARAWDNAGDEVRSLAALERIVRERSDSPLYVEAQFRRGELLFARRDYARAELAYQAVTAAGSDAPFYGQAQYKLGWARYQQARFALALGDFIAVLERSLVSGAEFRTVLAPGALPRAQRELVDDTLRAISLAFEHLGGPPAIDAWFEVAGTVSFEPLIHSSLAGHYLEREMYGEAVATLASFIRRHPEHQQAPLFQIRIAEVYERSGDIELADAARQGLVREYGPHSPYWQQRDLARMPAVAERLRAELLDAAQRSHAAAQESGSAADYAAAGQAYRDFLAFFPEDERAPELAFLLGELLFESGRYGEAVEYYEQSAYRYSPHARSAEAGYAALLSYERHVDGLDEAQARAWRARSTEAASRFASQFSRHPQVAAVLTRAAQDLFRNGHPARALTFALRVTTGGAGVAPAHRRAAWIVAGDVQVERGALDQAEAYYRNARAAAPAADGAPDPITERLAMVIYRQGEQARDQGNAAAAIALFERAAEAAPGSDIAEAATYDSAALAITAGDWTAAIARLEAFRREWPGSGLAGEVTRKLALAYLEDGRVHAAAEEFGRIAADEDEDPEVAREALWRSAELYEQAGDGARALIAWQRYIAAHPEPVDRAIQARLRIAEAFQAEGDATAQRRWLGEIVAAHDRAGGQGSDFSRQAAAQAALELAVPLREAYATLELRHPLERSLRAKREAMDAVLAAYGRAASYGVPEVTTRATYRIGETYREFARALLDSERPAGLTELELEEYDVLLEEQAFPFEEEAIKLHEVNYRRIGQGVYDAWVRASLGALAELVPVRYAKNERRIEYVETIH